VSAALRVGYLVAEKALIKDLIDVKVLTSVAGSHLPKRSRPPCWSAVLSEICGTAARAHARSDGRRGQESRPVQLGGVLRARRRQFSVGASARHRGFARTGALAETYGVSLAPGHFFRPGGETTAWVRINSAYAGEERRARSSRTPAAADQPSASPPWLCSTALRRE
jgi:hypothetical protein